MPFPGAFNYRPDDGFTGTDSFTYRIRDEHGEYSSFETVTIEVVPDPNRAPEAVADDYVVLQGESLTVDAPGRLANDYDVDGDSIITSHSGDPDNGTIESAYTSGGFVYTPDPDFVGVDDFTYRIRDEHGEYSGFETVTITVVEASNTGYADVAVSPDAVDFGRVSAGSTATETITVANVGDEDLSVTDATISGPDASAFDVTAVNESAVLGYGATTPVTVEYAPTAVGTANATLTVETDDPDEPTVDVALTGTSDDDEAPVVDALDLTGSFVDDSDSNGSVVYANDTVGFEAAVDDEHGSIWGVELTLEDQSSNDEHTLSATENGSTGNWTAEIDADALADGAYDLVVEATDDRGNRRTVVSNDTVVVDRDAPDLSAAVTRLDETTANVTVNANEELRAGTLAVDVEGPDGNVTTVPMLDEGPHWNGTVDLDGDGLYAVTATALDRAGNRGNDDANVQLATVSTANNTAAVELEPSDTFVRFNTVTPVNDTFVTMTESDVPVVALDRGQTGVSFIDVKPGARLSANLSNAVVGIPVNESLLPAGTDVDDVGLHHFNETRGQWTEVPTTVENATLSDGTTGSYWTATVPHFSTYGAVATDETPPTVTSTTPADGHEFEAGTTETTLRVGYDDPGSGVDPSEVGVVHDGTVVTADDATTITDTYVEYDVTGLSDGTSHEFEVTIVDEAGNGHTETVAYSVASPSTGSGGGPVGGGSGGGGGPSGDGGSSGGENPDSTTGDSDTGDDASVTATDLDVSPTSPVVGDEVTITTTLENGGDADANHTVVIRLDGDQIAEKAVEIAAEDTATVTATHVFDEPRRYEVAVADLTATVDVSEDEPGGEEPAGDDPTDDEAPVEDPDAGGEEPAGDDGSDGGDGTPGFGAIGAILALLAAARFVRR